jgi:hypothetical protein
VKFKIFFLSWFWSTYPKPPCTISNPHLVVPTWPSRSRPMKSFSLSDTSLTMSSKSFQNYPLTSSLKPTYGAYTIMTFKVKSSITNLFMMNLSLCLLIAIIAFVRLLSIKMHILILLRSFSIYHTLKSVFSTSLVFYPVHLVSWTHKIFICLIIVVSANSLILSIRDSIFQPPKQIILSPTSFLTHHSRRVKCEDLCSFGITSGR